MNRFNHLPLFQENDYVLLFHSQFRMRSLKNRIKKKDFSII